VPDTPDTPPTEHPFPHAYELATKSQWWIYVDPDGGYGQIQAIIEVGDDPVRGVFVPSTGSGHGLDAFADEIQRWRFSEFDRLVAEGHLIRIGPPDTAQPKPDSTPAS
jgi:hypothetical protein